MNTQEPTASSETQPAVDPRMTASTPAPPRLQGLPFHIQEDIWREVLEYLRPQVLFFELDALRGVPRKPYRDTASSTYQRLEPTLWRGKDDDQLADITRATDALTSRQKLRISTEAVRFFGSLCTNSRRIIIKAFPHTVGLGFAQHSNKKLDSYSGSRNNILRFNGDTDICVISAAQWEQQIHFLRNKDSISPAVKLIKNWGLSLETLWNDRIIQLAHSRQQAADAWNSPEHQAAMRNGGLYPSLADGRAMTGRDPIQLRHEWNNGCGCSSSDARREDRDWNPSAWATAHNRMPCPVVCKREPLPVFIRSLPNIRTLYLVATDRPPTAPPGDRGAYDALLASGAQPADFGLDSSLVPVNQGWYKLRPISDIEPMPTSSIDPAFMPLALRSIQRHWRRGFPYTERMPGVRVRLMQRITHELIRDEITMFPPRNTDIPYIFEASEVQDRKRQREFHHMDNDDPASRRGWKRNKTGTEIKQERDQ